jgi:hypothetical protein
LPTTIVYSFQLIKTTIEIAIPFAAVILLYDFNERKKMKTMEFKLSRMEQTIPHESN